MPDFSSTLWHIGFALPSPVISVLPFIKAHGSRSDSNKSRAITCLVDVIYGGPRVPLLRRDLAESCFSRWAGRVVSVMASVLYNHGGHYANYTTVGGRVHWLTFACGSRWHEEVNKRRLLNRHIILSLWTGTSCRWRNCTLCFLLFSLLLLVMMLLLLLLYSLLLSLFLSFLRISNKSTVTLIIVKVNAESVKVPSISTNTSCY